MTPQLALGDQVDPLPNCTHTFRIYGEGAASHPAGMATKECDMLP